jgi:hypothetical protein
LAALESRQDDIDGKVSQVLANTALHTKALAELKSMLLRCMSKDKESEGGSPSVSKFGLKN